MPRATLATRLARLDFEPLELLALLRRGVKVFRIAELPLLDGTLCKAYWVEDCGDLRAMTYESLMVLARNAEAA